MRRPILVLFVTALTMLTTAGQLPADAASSWAWPDAVTTGVPDGVAVVPSTGDQLVYRPGTVIDGIELHGCLEIVASNVVIRNSRIICANKAAAVWQTSSASGLLIEDSEIIGADGANAGAGIYSSTPYTARRVEIRGVDDGAFVGSGAVFEDNWVHSLTMRPGAHNDLIQMVGGTGVTIRHNRLDHYSDQTSAVMVKSDLAPIDGVAIVDNLVTGGAYSIYVYAGNQLGGCCDAPTNVTVVDNVFTGGYLYGAMAVQGTAVVACNVDAAGAAVTYYDSDRRTNPRVNPC